MRQQAIGAMLVDTFARPAKRSERPESRGTPTARRQPFRELACGLPVAHKANDARTSRQMRHETLEWRGVKVKGHADEVLGAVKEL